MATGKMMLNYTFEETSIGFQTCCLGGKIITQDDVNSRLDTADENFLNSCWRCFMKGHKIHGQCDTDSCPVKYAHRRVVKTLLNISDALQEIEGLELPYVRATEYPLDYIIDTYNDAIKEARQKHNNPGVMTGLDKIKTFFGGKN
jgi:hypothetical protein